MNVNSGIKTDINIFPDVNTQGRQELNFDFDNIEGRVQASQKLNSTTELTGDLKYLGTNVGQALLAEIGIKVINPNGMKWFAMAGYGARMSGFATRENILPTSKKPEGVSSKVGIETPEGVRADVEIQINSQRAQDSHVKFGVGIPLAPSPINRSNSQAASSLVRPHPSNPEKLLYFINFNGKKEWLVRDKQSIPENQWPQSSYSTHPDNSDKSRRFNVLSGAWENIDQDQVSVPLKNQSETPYRPSENPEKLLLFDPMENKWEEVDKGQVPAELRP